MPFNHDQRQRLQTNLARDKAEALLEGLLQARAEAEQRIANDDHLDPQRVAKGRHAMQRAIESAQRMVDSLNSAMEILQDDLDEQELSDLLDDCDDDDQTPPANQPKE